MPKLVTSATSLSAFDRRGEFTQTKTMKFHLSQSLAASPLAPKKNVREYSVFLVLAAMMTTGLTSTLSAQFDSVNSGIQLPTLKQELEFGLRARLPHEFTFVNQVVKLVNRGKLPVTMVKSTFVWSRRKNPYLPFPYFERGLRLRATRIGIDI